MSFVNSNRNYFLNNLPSHAEIIELSDDSEEENSISPKVEPPNSPSRFQSARTFELLVMFKL